MPSLSYAIGFLGVVLELVLLWRFLRERLWRYYPFLCAYVLYLASRTLILVVLIRHYGLRSHAYATFYWTSDIIAVGLWVFILWEIFRHSFPHGSATRGVVATVSALIAGSMTGLLLVTHTNHGLPRAMAYLANDFERYASLVVAPLILWLLAASRYYRVSLGRNVWGMAVGFGVLLSLSAVNCAAYCLGRSPQVISSFTFPAAFVLQLMIWASALWRYDPNPNFAPAPAERAELDFILWRQEWDRLLASMREGFTR